MIEIYIVLKEGVHKYYLAKVERCDFDVFCFLPKSDFHLTLHESGESHIRDERGAKKPIEGLPVVLVMGQAGEITDKGIICESLSGLGCSICICTAIFPITSLSDDFRKFNRNAEKCFVIDKSLFPKNNKEVEVGIWAVPERNKISFEFNNPGIPEKLLYKVVQCEPQIWIYARLF